MESTKAKADLAIGYYWLHLIQGAIPFRAYWDGEVWSRIEPNGTVQILDLSEYPDAHWQESIIDPVPPVPASDYIEQSERGRTLAEWYLADGRDDPAHPMHGMFTGLADKARAGCLGS